MIPGDGEIFSFLHPSSACSIVLHQQPLLQVLCRLLGPLLLYICNYVRSSHLSLRLDRDRPSKNPLSAMYALWMQRGRLRYSRHGSLHGGSIR